MHRLQMKAQQAFRDANSGMPLSVPNDIFQPTQAGAVKDEMSIFSGKTNTVTTKVHSSAAAPGKAGASTSTIALSSRGSSSGKESRASSGSPRQMFTDNPQFANVHPSLVSELHDFHGHIKAQIQNAMRNGEELFAGTPMVVDSAPTVRHRHSQKQIAYHAEQAMVLERQERERAEAEQREIEELERQEVARKQQLQQQLEIQRQYTQQHELQRQQDAIQQQRQHVHQQQQLDIQRQQEKMQQQQRQEQYRQQVDAQQLMQQQHQQQQHMSQFRHHGYNSDEPAYTPAGGLHHASQPHSVPSVPPPAHPQRQNPHPYPPAAISQSYPPPPPPHEQYHRSIEGPPSAAPHSTAHHPHHTIQPPHSQAAPQHAMYPVPTGYNHRSAADVTHMGPPPPDAHHGQGYAPGAPYSQQTQEDYKYWPAASSSFAMPDQQPISAAYTSGAHLAHQHYTPEGALRGIAADDSSLQETWQLYMGKVRICLAN